MCGIGFESAQSLEGTSPHFARFAGQETEIAKFLVGCRWSQGEDLARSRYRNAGHGFLENCTNTHQRRGRTPPLRCVNKAHFQTFFGNRLGPEGRPPPGGFLPTSPPPSLSKKTRLLLPARPPTFAVPFLGVLTAGVFYALLGTTPSWQNAPPRWCAPGRCAYVYDLAVGKIGHFWFHPVEATRVAARVRALLFLPSVAVWYYFALSCFPVIFGPCLSG